MGLMRKSGLLAGVLALGACGGGLPISTAPQSVRFTGEVPLSLVQSYDPVELRTRIGKDEAPGAGCRLEGNGFTATVMTPALINLPVFGDKTRAVTVHCKLGENARTQVFQPYNATSKEKQSAAYNNGVIGAVVVGIAEGVRDRTNDHYTYRGMVVTFE